MLIVILVVSTILVVFGATLATKSYDWDGVGIGVCALFAGVGIVSLIMLAVGICEVSMAINIDKKIEMYQTENAQIESQICGIIERYQEHETQTYMKFAPEEAMTAITLYPNLKSDTLVREQIEVYVKNNEKIKSLKEEQINADVWRWWVYFGGNT